MKKFVASLKRAWETMPKITKLEILLMGAWMAVTEVIMTINEHFPQYQTQLCIAEMAISFVGYVGYREAEKLLNSQK